VFLIFRICIAKIRKFVGKGKFSPKSNEKQKTAWQPIKKAPKKETFLWFYVKFCG